MTLPLSGQKNNDHEKAKGNWYNGKVGWSWWWRSYNFV